MELEQVWRTGTALLTALGLKIIGAIIAWIVGRALIRLAVRLVVAALARQRVDTTLTRYVSHIVNVALTTILIVALLGYFGVETTSFAALIAGIGIAIGAAWAGLLANFAAGAFLIVLRPFRVGDYVKVAGVEGSVREIGIFSTTIEAADHVLAIVGNNRIFAETIQNFTASPIRRVERTAQLAHSVDVQDAIRRLKAALAQIPNVVKHPEPEVEIADLTPRGPLLAVRPYAATASYWQVYFDTNRAIFDTVGEAAYPVPTGQAAAPRPAAEGPRAP